MRLLISGIFICMCFVSSAQDVIVRITGDSLHVEIESANDSFIYFRSSETRRNDIEVISRKEVMQILYGFEKPGARLERVARRADRAYEQIQLSMAFSGFFLPNPGIADNSFKEYYTKLQYGIGFTADANFFFNKILGVGVSYSNAQFSNSILVEMTATGKTGYLSDDLTLQYLGAGLVLRFPLGNSATHFIFGGGIGMNYYNNDAAIIYGYNLKSNGLGFHFNGSLNFDLARGFYLPLKFNYMGHDVNQFHLKTNTDMPEELKNDLEDIVRTSEKFVVTRMSLSVGLLFAF